MTLYERLKELSKYKITAFYVRDSLKELAKKKHLNSLLSYEDASNKVWLNGSVVWTKDLIDKVISSKNSVFVTEGNLAGLNSLNDKSVIIDLIKDFSIEKIPEGVMVHDLKVEKINYLWDILKNIKSIVIEEQKRSNVLLKEYKNIVIDESGGPVIIKDNVVIHANCSIVKNVSISSNCLIHPGCVLGSDGFGFAPSQNGYVKIEQLGGLKIGKNVEIGANCSIDRGALDDTEIKDGVILDNLIHIAHNVILGEDSAIAASCAIAGSTKIGKNFRMGGLSGVLGHLEICDDVSVGAHTLITKDIQEPGDYVGIMPAQSHKNWAKSSVFIKKQGK